MVVSLRFRQGARAAKRGFLALLIVLAVAALGVGFFGEGALWLPVLVGYLVAVGLVLSSTLTVNLLQRSGPEGSAWVMLDFLVKILLVFFGLLLLNWLTAAKSETALVVLVLVLPAVIGTSAVQVVAFWRARSSRANPQWSGL